MSRFRILSLDGGGIKGTFTASVLAELEAMTGKRMVEYFDLITGTSTGGIIAVALGLGMPAQEIVAFYCAKGPDIFPRQGYIVVLVLSYALFSVRSTRLTYCGMRSWQS